MSLKNRLEKAKINKEGQRVCSKGVVSQIKAKKRQEVCLKLKGQENRNKNKWVRKQLSNLGFIDIRFSNGLVKTMEHKDGPEAFDKYLNIATEKGILFKKKEGEE